MNMNEIIDKATAESQTEPLLKVALKAISIVNANDDIIRSSYEGMKLSSEVLDTIIEVNKINTLAVLLCMLEHMLEELENAYKD